MTKTATQTEKQHSTETETMNEKSHKWSLSTLAEGDHGQEITQLIDALRKIGYFKSFQTTENMILNVEKDTETRARKLKPHRKARYRRIKKYYKSIKQYQKERFRRKLCWLLSGKYKETEIAEMLGINVRTVIRDMNRIKPYYYRLSRSYFSKLEQDKIREFNIKLDGATLKQQYQILSKALTDQLSLMRQRQYNHHVHKIFIDLDYIQYDGFPRITTWPQSHNPNVAMPIILEFICVKNGEKQVMGRLQFNYAGGKSYL